MTIKVDKTSAVPYYHQIKEAVRTLIARGRLKTGDMLPTEFSLSEQLGVSRLVVHRALRELVTEGLLIRQRGKGTFVAPPAWRGQPVVGPLMGLTESLARYGLSLESRILVQEVVPATGEVQSELALPEGSPVFHLTSLRLVDHLPVAVDDVYHPAERFPALATIDWTNRSVYATLEKLYGAVPHDALDVITAGPATRDEAGLLGINKGAPVMRSRRTATDRQGLPVEFSTVVFHAERYQVVARMRRAG